MFDKEAQDAAEELIRPYVADYSSDMLTALAEDLQGDSNDLEDLIWNLDLPKTKSDKLRQLCIYRGAKIDEAIINLRDEAAQLEREAAEDEREFQQTKREVQLQ